MSKQADQIHQDNDLDVEAKERRKFLEKFGKLALVTPVAVSALMTPATSAAPRSGCNKNGKGCK